MEQVSLTIAFFAGVVSFLSPCVLPIIPGFLAYLAGVSSTETQAKRWVIFLNSVFFVAGFSVIFALLGVLLNTLLRNIAYDVQLWLSRFGGVVIIFFGLYLVGLIKIKWFERQHQFKVTTSFKSKYTTSFLFGAAFAAGWTPCVGAVLGSILGLATTMPGSAFSLLLVYSIGLGVPFLLVGLFTSQADTVIRRFSPYIHYVNIVFGAVLIILGILVFTQSINRLGNLEFLNRWLLR